MGSKQKTKFYFHLHTKADNIIDSLSEAKQILDNNSEVISISVYNCDTDELIATVLQNGVAAFNRNYKG